MSKKIYIQHNKICFACGIERHKKELGYEISTLKTYCTDKNRCPNGSEIPDVELVELNTDSLRHAIAENFEADVVTSLNSILGKTVGARVSPALGMHLLKFAEAEGIYSINATIIHILEEHFANNEVTDELEGSNFTHKQEPKAKTVTQEELEEIERKKLEERMEKHPDMELSIKVNDKPVQPEPPLKFGNTFVEIPIEKKVEQGEDDDEFTF